MPGWRRSWGPLFEHRKGRWCSTNTDGFSLRVENVFGELNTCMQTVQRLYENSQKMLSLGCSIDGFLPDVLQSFSRVHPEIGIRQFRGSHPAGPAVGGAHSPWRDPRPLNHTLLSFRLLGQMAYGLFLHREHPVGDSTGSWPSWRANPDRDASRLDARALRAACRAVALSPR
ncbi:MAG: hypothetical protein ACLRIS_12815 [Flavonifractor plautii]